MNPEWQFVSDDELVETYVLPVVELASGSLCLAADRNWVLAVLVVIAPAATAQQRPAAPAAPAAADGVPRIGPPQSSRPSVSPPRRGSDRHTSTSTSGEEARQVTRANCGSTADRTARARSKGAANVCTISLDDEREAASSGGLAFTMLGASMRLIAGVTDRTVAWPLPENREVAHPRRSTGFRTRSDVRRRLPALACGRAPFRCRRTSPRPWRWP